jgi:iron complex outermembrane receptor protein
MLPRLTIGVAFALLCAPFALAQTSTTTDSDSAKNSDQVVELEKFEVSAGFIGSLTAAAAAKADAPTITEQIVSEDIGKLPDVSIADALTRLPGITTQRTNGRSQDIIIRGLTGDFSTGLLNGLEQVSTDENRKVEYDQYPAELLDRVIIYKTAQANLTNQGLAGTVDLRFVQPLAKGHRIVAANAYYDWTALKQLTPGESRSGNHFSASYIDQSPDKTIGVALGYAHSDKPFEGEQFQAWGSESYPTDPSGNIVLGGTKSYVRTSHFKRDGFAGALEYRPNNYIHSTIDVFVSRFEEKQLLRGMEIPLYWGGGVVNTAQSTSNGLQTVATFTNVQPVVRNDEFKRNDSPFSISWNLDLGEKSEWPINIDAGFSRVARTDVNLETYSGLGLRNVAANPDTVTVKLIPGQLPVITTKLNYADGSILKLTDPQGWGPPTLPGNGMYGYLKYFQAKDELGEVKASTEHKIGGMLKSVEVGASFTERYKRDGEGPSGYINTPNGQITLPLPPKVGTTDMSFLGLGQIYAYDPIGSYAAGTWGFTPNTDTGIVANRFDVTEKITQPYAQLNLSTKAGDMPFSGDVGVRAIHVDQTSKGYSANGPALNYVSDGARYTDWAPDLNLRLEFLKDTFLRFSAARQIARPRMYDMRASRSWGYDPTKAGTGISTSPWSGSGGNPQLRPWRADSFDVSLEHYFKDHQGYISLAAYDKKLLTYIYTQSSVADFSGYPVPSGNRPTFLQGVVSQAANGQGGNIRGLEATVELQSDLLTGNAVKGFGVVLNGAYTDSSVQPWGPGNGTAPIAGLSRKVASGTIYYERYGFSIRVSERYRSSTREYITTFGPPNRGGDVSPGSGFTTAQPEKVVDAQVSYALQSGPVKGLTFYFQAYNLNNEPLVTFGSGDPRQVMNYQKYGASYSAGVSYRF